MSSRPCRPVGARSLVRGLLLTIGSLLLGAGSSGADVGVASPVYVTQLGGHAAEEATATAMDDEGCLYVAGWTRSGDFPTTAEAVDEHVDGRDAFVAKLAADGQSLVWCTVLGGSRDEEALTLLVDGEGAVVVGGWTSSDDFPTTGRAHRRERQGWKDGFVAVLDPNGGRLLASSYVGGSSNDVVTGLALAPDLDLVLTGWTESRDLPTLANAAQPGHAGDQDAFVVRLDADASNLRFATYLGGRGEDQAVGVGFDGQGYIVVAGTTGSSDFPVSTGAFDATRNGRDVFVSRLSNEGGRLYYSTFYGGSNDEVAHAFVLAEDGGAVVVGTTRSDDLPVTGPEGGRRAGRRDGFVLHLSGSGGALVFARYLGGAGEDALGGVAVDAMGQLWVAGRTSSEDLPVTDAAMQRTRGGGSDALFARLDARTGVALFLSYLGGAGDEDARALTPDRFHGGVGFAGLALRSELGSTTQAGRGAASDVLAGRLVPGRCGVPAAALTLASGGEARFEGTFPRIGGRVTLTLSGALPLAPGLLYLGTPVGDPRVYDGVGTLHLDPGSALVLSEFTTGAAGDASFVLRVPEDPELCGLRVVLQPLVAGRAADAVEFTVGG